jgi:hypothetical protein
MSEAVVPGGSNLVQGHYKQGLLHTAAGVMSAIAFGPAGPLLVIADSLHKSVTGTNLYERVISSKPEAPAAVEETPDATLEPVPKKRP